MISKKSKGFCPKPLKSPDPDRHNRSAITFTTSPDFRQPASQDEVSSQYLELKRQNTILKKELQRMRVSDVTVKRQPYQTRINELETEIRKMRETIRLLSNDNDLEQQNRTLLKKVDDLLTENNTLKEDIKEIYKIDKFIKEQIQFIEMRLKDRETRLEKAQSYIDQMKYEKSRAKPIARGDSGIIEDDQVVRLQIPYAELEQHCRNLQERLSSHEKFMQDMLSIDKNKDTEVNSLLKSLREKEHQIFNLRNTNKILDERASIVRSQLEEVYKKLQEKTKQLQAKSLQLNMKIIQIDVKRVEIGQLRQQFHDEPSKDYEIQRLRRQIRELSRIIEARRDSKDSSIRETMRQTAISQQESLKKYILTLNDTMEADRRKILNLESQNEQLRAAASVSVSQAIKNETISKLQRELSQLRLQSQDALARQRKINEQLQKQLRNCESVKTEMSYRMNQLISQNNLANAALIRQRTRFDNQVERSRRAQPELHSLRQEMVLLRSSQERKTSQLRQVMEQLARTKESLLSFNIDDMQNKLQGRIRDRHTKIKISVQQKDALKKQSGNLTQQIVILKEQMTKMHHQRNIMAAQIDRINYEKEIMDKNSQDLTRLIKQYVEYQNIPAKQSSTHSHSALEPEIYRQIMEISSNTDLTSLKLSLKRMEQTVERVRLQLQKIQPS